MPDLTEILTKDGSYSLRSNFFNESFHSFSGALEETKIKFTEPSDLKRFEGKCLSVLDICFGLGYNSASLFNDLIKQKSFLRWYALEVDKRPLEYSIEKKSFQKLWDPKITRIFESLYLKNEYNDNFFKCEILWGEAREKIKRIPPKIKFDLIRTNLKNL